MCQIKMRAASLGLAGEYFVRRGDAASIASQEFTRMFVLRTITIVRSEPDL